VKSITHTTLEESSD